MMNKTTQYKELKWNQELLERFWAHIALRSDAIYFSEIYGSAIIRILKSLIPDEGHVVDYGGGTGAIVSGLLAAGYKGTLIDQSKDAISHVNNKYKEEANFLGGFLISECELLKTSADSVLMIEVIEHMYDSQLEVALNNVKGFLRQSGKLLITVPNDEDLTLNQMYCPNCNHVWHRMQHVRKWDAKSLREYLEKNGFVLESLTETHILPNSKLFLSKKYFMGSMLALLKKLTFQNPPHLIAVATKE